MLPTTSGFDIAVTDTIREPRARVRITWSDPVIDTGLTFAVNGENNVSDKAHVADTITETEFKWFLLNGDSLLDDDYKLFPVPTQGVYQVGWYGNELSDGSGEFVTNPTLQVNFPAKPIFGVTLVGDSMLNEYPVAFTIKIRTGTTVHETITETTNTELYYTHTASVTSANNILLEISEWSETGTVVKIVEFYSSIIRVYEGDVIKNISVLEEREIRDSTNPIGNISSNEATIELQNINVDNVIDPFFPGNTDSELSTLLKPGRKVVIEFGFPVGAAIEYIPMGTYWSGDFNIQDNSPTISFTARDRMELLRKNIYDDNEFKSSQDLDDFINDVLISAKNKVPQLIYSIDSNLSSITIPYTFMNRINYFEALKNIMYACGGQAYMNRLDALIVESSAEATYYTGSPDLFITKSEYFTKDQPAHYEDVINKIEIETQPLDVTSGSPITVYESNESISLPASATLDPIELVYNSFPVSGVSDTDVTLTGTGCTPVINDSEYYSWGCVLTIQNSVGTAGTFTISIDGDVYEIKGKIVVSDTDDDSIEENKEKVYRLPENALIQETATAEDITSDLIGFYADPRNDLILKWRGNPALELGDIIVVPEYQKGTIDSKARFKIYKLETEYDGGLKQTISARRINTYT